MLNHNFDQYGTCENCGQGFTGSNYAGCESAQAKSGFSKKPGFDTTAYGLWVMKYAGRHGRGPSPKECAIWQSTEDEAAIRSLTKQVEHLAEALKFYAAEKSYLYVERPDGLDGRGDSTVMKDFGHIASTALTNYKKDTK